MKLSIFRDLFLGTILAAYLSANANAEAFTGQFTFGTSTQTNVPSYAYNGVAIPGVTVSPITKVGVTSASGSSAFQAKNWSLGAIDGSDVFTGSIDTGRYFEFTLTAQAGFVLDLASLSFGFNGTPSGPRQYEWRSSVDNFAAAISTYSAISGNIEANNLLNNGVFTTPGGNFSTSYGGNTIDLSDTAYQDLGQVTFRFYGYNAETVGGNGGLAGAPLSFAGNAEAVPEPSVLALGGIAAMGAILMFRRRVA